MFYLAEEINKFAKKSLRVILSNNGPVCLNATILVEMCTSIKINNIVAVTSDIGLLPISIIARETGLDISDLGAPPIWGCTGIKGYIDVCSIIKRCDIYRPYSRAITTKGGSTLPLGTIRTELRYLTYMTEDLINLIDQDAQDRKVNNLIFLYYTFI